MMLPIKTEHTNVLLGAPKDWKPETDGECIALPVHRDEANGRWLSWYRPTEQDIANILAGKPVRLSIFGSGHPPVAIAVTDATDL
ncbi:hypothetical protein [Cupriavidus nantongensis]